jgi:hypothetical protein
MPTERCTFWVERRTPGGWVGVVDLDGTEWYVGRELFLAVCGPVPGGTAWWDRGPGRQAGLGPPRGLPADVSAAVLAASERAAERGFCHSWAALAELEALAGRQPGLVAHAAAQLDWVLREMRACGSPGDVRAVVWYQDRG